MSSCCDDIARRLPNRVCGFEQMRFRDKTHIWGCQVLQCPSVHWVISSIWPFIRLNRHMLWYEAGCVLHSVCAPLCPGWVGLHERTCQDHWQKHFPCEALSLILCRNSCVVWKMLFFCNQSHLWVRFYNDNLTPTDLHDSILHSSKYTSDWIWIETEWWSGNFKPWECMRNFIPQLLGMWSLIHVGIKDKPC